MTPTVTDIYKAKQFVAFMRLLDLFGLTALDPMWDYTWDWMDEDDDG